jgi:malonate decarboxylase epsilon subunit
MSVLFTFPGQGAQVPGMLHMLPDHPAVSATLAEAADALHDDPLKLDTQQALASTVAVQLCLLISGVAMAHTLIARGGAPDMVTGLSIGAYPAAVVAGTLDFADAVRLVARRGQLMERAYPAGYGMAAIIGLDRQQVEELIASIHSAATPVYLANVNASRQMVISGSDAALQTVMARALDSGATKVDRLAVSVPSHCELFDQAAQDMRVAFSQTRMAAPKAVYLSASRARAMFDPALIAIDLAENMARQVNWPDTARLAWERGARLAVEMPPGAVLTNLTAAVFADGLCVSCNANRLDTLLGLIAREHSVGDRD